MNKKYKTPFMVSFIIIFIFSFLLIYKARNKHYGFKECIEEHMQDTKTNVAAANLRAACSDFDKYDVAELKLEAECIIKNMGKAENDVAAATLAKACRDEFEHYKKHLP